MIMKVSSGDKKYTKKELNNFSIYRLNKILEVLYYRPPTPPKDSSFSMRTPKVNSMRTPKVNSMRTPKVNSMRAEAYNKKEQIIEKILKLQEEN